MAEDRTPSDVAEEELAFDAPERGSADELLDAGAHSEIDAMRHSAAHVMAEAVMELFPGTKLGIGPAIEDGFYYDFQLPRALTPEDLGAIEARMVESVKANHPFVRRELPPEEPPGPRGHPERLLALLGTHDELLPFEEMRQRYASCTLRVVPGGDHALSGFEAWLPEVMAFLGL